MNINQKTSLVKRWSQDVLRVVPASQRRNPVLTRETAPSLSCRVPAKTILEVAERSSMARADAAIHAAGGSPEVASKLVYDWAQDPGQPCADGLVVALGRAGALDPMAVAAWREEQIASAIEDRDLDEDRAGEYVDGALRRCIKADGGVLKRYTEDDLVRTAAALVCASRAMHPGRTTLHRGIGEEQVLVARRLSAQGHPIEIGMRPLSSWTEDQSIARAFAKKNRGVVLTLEADPILVVLTHRLDIRWFKEYGESEVVLHLWPSVRFTNEEARIVFRAG